jgi:hypothetical protein
MAGIAELEHRVVELDGSGQRLAGPDAVGAGIRQ